MSFVTGLLLLDAPASALNNAKDAEDAVYKNETGIKMIRSSTGRFPYVSSQAFRYWLRTTLETDPEWAGNVSPVFRWTDARGTHIAYTDGNPIEYWDDDLLGYMRTKSGGVNELGITETDMEGVSVTRTSPLRTSTLVSIAPVNVVRDWGTMTRLSGNPIVYVSQFYRAVLKGLFSLDLNSAGTFSYRDKSGFRNLDEVRIEAAKAAGLEHLEDRRAYRLNFENRAQRVSHLLRGLGQLDGGAKQALHYTDVAPVVIMAGVFRGGNNPLHYVIGADDKGRPRVNTEALSEMVRVWGDQLSSKLYVGWVRGFHDEQRDILKKALAKNFEITELGPADDEASADEGLPSGQNAQDEGDGAGTKEHGAILGHPREVLNLLAGDVQGNASWFDQNGRS